MASVAEVIRQHQGEILALWTEQAERTATARGISGPAFQHVLPTFLSSLAGAPDSAPEQARHIEGHLAARLRQGFELTEILDELLMLGCCVARFWEGLPPEQQPAPSDVERFNSNLQAASLAFTRLFQEHMDLDEQQEKRYLRMLQAIADEALHSESQPLIERLQDVVHLVMEATGSQVAGILLVKA